MTQTGALSIGKAVHEARRLRREGKLDDALLTLADADASHASLDQRRWLYNEWLELVQAAFRAAADRGLHAGRRARRRPRTGRSQGDLEVVAALGMKWRPGKVVSRGACAG